MILKLTILPAAEQNFYTAAIKLWLLVKHMADRSIGESAYIYFVRKMSRGKALREQDPIVIKQVLEDLSTLMRTWAFCSIVLIALASAYFDVIPAWFFSDDCEPNWIHHLLLASSILYICYMVS